MRLRILLLFLGGTGCDYVWRLDEVTEPEVCADPLLDDRFDDLTPCATWSQPNMQGGCVAEETADGLVFQPAAVVDSRCRCQTSEPVPLSESGIMVEVTGVLGGDDFDYTALGLQLPIDLSIGVANGMLRFSPNDGFPTNGELPYVADTMRWWRLRRAGAAIAADYSKDGRSWLQLGPPIATTQTDAVMFLSAGLNPISGPTPEGTAVFRRLIVCR